MSDWTPPPEPVTWRLPAPISEKGVTYTTVTLRAPTGEDVLKATAAPASNLEATLRLISAVSGEQIPYEALVRIPDWLRGQMSDYFDTFTMAPVPDPLAQWRQARAAAVAGAPAPETAS